MSSSKNKVTTNGGNTKVTFAAATFGVHNKEVDDGNVEEGHDQKYNIGDIRAEVNDYNSILSNAAPVPTKDHDERDLIKIEGEVY